MTSLALIETQKIALLDRLAAWPEPQLYFRPAPAQWSALDVLDHLVRTESAILQAARDGLLSPRKIGLTDRLRTAFLERIFRSRRRVKAPGHVTQIFPGPALRFSEVRDRWDAVRLDLSQFLVSSPPQLLRRGIFYHPVGGWMNAESILGFFSVHMIHHTYQLDRLQAACARPVTS
ncbi:MAG TPA: DinB family protein [Dongiaceae bacterium]|nr:DinB family protein [Dongiaceae bacterium]